MDLDFWFMVGLMVVFSYAIMSNVMLTWRNGVYNHINKAYMALLMGSLMGMIHYIIMIIHGHTNAWKGLIIWIIISLIFIILIRKQILINDRQFLKGMTEHHDMALLMSEEILKKTSDPKLKELAEEIIRSQQYEINLMKSWL